MDDRDRQTIEALIGALEKAYGKKKTLIFRSLLSGIFSGIGAALGLALLVVVLGFIIHFAGGIPYVGQNIADFLTNVSKSVKR